MHPCGRLLVIIVLLTFPGSAIFSQPLKRLSHVSWNVNEGLLQSHVMDMAEDGNGFIWISSGGGVQRFDGRNFHHIPASSKSNGIPDDRFVAFFALKNGNLWLSHQKGISEYDIHTNRFRHVHAISAGLEEQYRVIAEEADGIWYWHSSKGFYKLNKQSGRLTDSVLTGRQQMFSLTAGPPIYTGSFFVQYGADVLLITNRYSGKSQLLRSPEGRRWFFAAEKYLQDSVLVATGRGIEMLDCKTGTLSLFQSYKTNPGLVTLLHPVQLKLVSPTICLVGEANKLFELDLKERKYASQLTNLQNQDFAEIGYITGFFHDSHSNLWIISENDGIKKVNYHFVGFRYFGTPSRKNNYVKTIYADKDDNRVLCGTFGEGMLIFDTSQHLLKAIPELPGIKGPVTVCGFIRTAPHHYLCIVMGTWDLYLLNTLDYSTRKVSTVMDHSALADKHPPDYHLGIFNINDSVSILQNGYYIDKLVRRSSGGVVIYSTERLGLASVSAALVNGKLWIGSYGRFFLSDPGFTHFRSLALAENKLVRCFAPEDSGMMWMGTEKGLHLLDSTGAQLALISKSDGLPDENIYAARRDKSNNLWLSHNKGISCRKPDGSFLHFSRSDGLQENEFNTNTSFETGDGELFFGGVNGISSFYPGAVTGVQETPNVVITRMQIKDADWSADTAYWNISKVTLPYYSDRISLDLTAIGNRLADQYNYQYKINGQDAEWVNVGNNPQLRFALQPGEYVIQYYAGNSFEKNPTGAKQLLLVIRPPFWRTGWFLTLLVLTIALLTVLITRYVSQVKLRKRVEELERKKALDEERIRISREMHDDIGAGLTQITLMSERAKQTVLEQESFGEIADVSRKLVSSMNEIIWSLNVETNTLEQLLAYMREQLNKLLEYSGIQYEIRFPQNGQEIILNNAQRRNLLLVTKEIVHNAIKHSGAKLIVVECVYAQRRLSFTITDDGKGFNSGAKSTGHGLRNVRRRIEELNGTLQIVSSPREGSRFIYHIPLA